VNIYEYIDDLFNLEEVLKKTDDLIIIMKDEPNETTEKTLKNIWEQDGIFVTIFNIKRLQFNVLEHALVPPHYPLNEEEASFIKNKYNILADDQVPDISRFSPVAQAIGLRPGQMCHIVRPSKTAISADFYRICSS
jgi:DNA-directed RNA polymerase subunit H (RpoH/RPB5)